MTEVVITSTQGIIDHLIAIGDRVTARIIEFADNARTNAANVKAAQLRFAQVEAVGQADGIVAPPSPRSEKTKPLPTGK